MADAGDAPDRTFKITSRRYLGNKAKMAGRIRGIVDANCMDVRTFADVFAGTGSVAAAFADKRLVTNDILYSNYVCHVAWFSSEPYDRTKLAAKIAAYNAAPATDDNYMSENFADTYFSAADCRLIGFVREDIECEFSAGRLNVRERALLVTSLLYAMDAIANTCGHYDAYRRGVASGRRIVLRLPEPPRCAASDNECFNEDANALVRRLVADVVFIDPPYNSRQYSDAYHVLENVARWEKPPVRGVARKMDRGGLKSDYCTSHAEDAFADLVRSVRARYIVMTYNNMGEQGNGRSNAKLSDAAILRALEAKGRVQVFSVSHKAFSAGKSDRQGNVERVFLCTCRPTPLVASPLNYPGGKFRILPQILPHFPSRVGTFVDLFCGGGSVGANVDAGHVVLRDSCRPLASLLTAMRDTDPGDFDSAVRRLVARFGLSDSEANGYAAYGCASADGLQAFNRPRYADLRDHYAALEDGSLEKSAALYALVAFAFNNQIRFNSRGAFNTPVGKRDFNGKMRRKLAAFARRLHERDFEIQCSDFRELDCDALSLGDFVYADPPYLVTTATYNENGGWTETDERDLLAMLDVLYRRGCGFALSNVTESKGRRNEILSDWLSRNRDAYRVVPIRRSYANANYHRKGGDVTREVLVIGKKKEASHGI